MQKTRVTVTWYNSVDKRMKEIGALLGLHPSALISMVTTSKVNKTDIHIRNGGKGMIRGEEKTKEQLMKEVKELGSRVAELEKAGAEEELQESRAVEIRE